MAVLGALVVVTHQVTFRALGVELNSFLISWKDEVEYPTAAQAIPNVESSQSAWWFVLE